MKVGVDGVAADLAYYQRANMLIDDIEDPEGHTFMMLFLDRDDFVKRMPASLKYAQVGIDAKLGLLVKLPGLANNVKLIPVVLIVRAPAAAFGKYLPLP